MLDYIRSNAQSFGVKLAFGIIILVFVFWGVGSLNDRGAVNVVAMVNGEPILAQQFEQVYRQAEESVLRNNPGITREQLKEQHLGRQVLRDLIAQTLLTQEAARAGVSVTPLELRVAVGQVKGFQDAQGRFDPEAYKRLLAAQRVSPAQYEQDMARDLLRQKIFSLVTASAWVDPGEALNRYNFLRQKRAVDYIFIPAKNFEAKADPTDAEVASWYESHKQEFAIPSKVDVAYVRVKPEALVRPESFSAADAEKWYAANASRFEEPEQVRAAHILVPLAQDAPEAEVKKAAEAVAKIQAELKDGKDFAAVADAHNVPNAAGPGGDLGWVRRGMTVKPFEDAAFAQQPGTVSAPVRSPFGLHLIKVEEKKGGDVKSFKDAEAEVRTAMAQEQGADKLHDVLDSLIEDNILGKSLAESAARFGLTAEETGFASQAELEQKLGVTAAGAASLVATPAGSPVDTALEAGDSYLVARILKSEPASTEPLDAVKGRIVARLTAEKALADAMADAAAQRRKLADGPLSDALKQSLHVRSAPAMERNGALADFAPDTALAEAVFAARPGAWLPTAFAVDSKSEGKGALLCRVAAVQPPEPGEWDMVKDLMANGVARERADGLFEIFMQRLASGAKVEVLNADLVDRKNL